MIELKNIYKEFKSERKTVHAINGVDLTIQKGEIYGIIGYSGAGKSTLVRLFNGLETPTQGTVTIDGQVISNLKGRLLRKKRQEIGMIFQHFNLLWSRTVEENIVFPLEIAGVDKAKRMEKAQELIKLVGLEGREKAYPSELSGGQKQRVGVARALANDPEVLLCDEATSALDPQTTDEVLDLLLEINRKINITIVLITHEMHVVRKICDKVAVMEEGKIIEQGRVLDLFKSPKEAVTKRFVQQEVTPDLESTHIVFEEMLKQFPDGKIIGLTFHGDQAKLPIISEVLRQFPDLDLSVIEGNIHQTQEGSIGTLYIQLLGPDEQIEEATQLLHTLRVQTEVVTNG